MRLRKPLHGLLAMLLACLLVACEKPDPLQTTRILAMGTVIDITTWGVSPRDARAAFEDLQTLFQRWHQEWHAWLDSPLSRANQAFAEGREATLTPDLLTMLEHARAAAHASEGLFNPAIGRLIELWGFHADERPDGPPPSQAAIMELLRKQPSVDDIIVDGDRVRSTNPAVALDFGGLKGYAVDRAIDYLRAHGIQNAIVNAGGNLRAIGSKGGQPWRIGIRNPRGPGVLASIELSGDESVATSGDYERFFEWHGVRYHHILDPRSGFPSIGTTAVTVLAPTAELADIAGKPLMIAGPAKWLELAHRLGITQALRVDESGRVEITPALSARLKWEIEPAPPVEVTAAP